MEIARLVEPPRSDEPHLTKLLDAFSSVIETARQSVLDDRVNVFDQHHVSSFIRGRSYRRPLLVRLQEGTYKRYKAVWGQLLCFVYRRVVDRQGPPLYYLLTNPQSDAVVELVSAMQKRHNNMHVEEGQEDAATNQQQGRIQRTCL